MNDDPADLDRLLADFERLTGGAPRPSPAVGRTITRSLRRLVQAAAALVAVAAVGVVGVLFVGALSFTAGPGGGTPSDGPVTIRTESQPSTVCMNALVSGVLVADPTYGLALRNPDYVQGVIWPFGYTARRESGVIVLIDPSGHVIAHEGDTIVGSGGSTNGDAVSVQCDIEVNPSPWPPSFEPGPTPPPVETPPNPTVHPTTAPTDVATAACLASVDGLAPMVTVRSGSPTVAAAYEVTGEQLTRYFDTELDQGGWPNGADWWNDPTTLVDLCILDGDFDTETPGPPGHNTLFTEILVVIDNGDPFAWVFSDRGQIPTTDPATIAEPSSSPSRRPVDSSIQAVSRSMLGPDAQAALDACNIESLGMGAVGGMGLVPAANQVWKYAPLSGREPELQSTAPAWVIQLVGEVPQLLSGEVWLDPICVVIDGSPGWYATGDVVLQSGAVVSPEPVADPPIYSLPPLAP